MALKVTSVIVGHGSEKADKESQLNVLEKE